MNKCPLCDDKKIELEGFADLRLFGLSPSEILWLKQFYICQTGDVTLRKLAERTTEKGLQG